ncbi:alpha/beta hydrolase family protein [Halobacillus salinus]|uniref:alpha/beta hydrolase family protein n=1 Tax=Halobacillus salinus TaxID=192814 RepID=UPI00159171B7|nr:prolyl oligopeptidase family serine peptidase [Halobacillus salinus]
MLVLIFGCEQADQPVITNQEQIDVPKTDHSTTTESYRLTYNSDGAEVVAYMVKPKGVDQPLPLLIYNRGGNQGYGRIDRSLLANYLSLWANKGYVVLASQYRGNDGGEGKEEFGGADVRDVRNLQNVAAELPEIDLEHKFMIGKSRGGMMAYLAMKQGMDLDAVSVVGGVTDVLRIFEDGSPSMKRVLIDLIGPPDENKDAYIERSAIYWPDKLDLPLMILHGEEDLRVKVQQARELYKEVKKTNADVEYIEYEGGDHSLSNHIEDYTEMVDRWFKSHAG